MNAQIIQFPIKKKVAPRQPDANAMAKARSVMKAYDDDLDKRFHQFLLNAGIIREEQR
jgi:hypothetical protein